MSALKFELEAEIRQDIGKGASRRLRHTNKVPAVVYGAGENPVSLTLDHDKVVTALANEAFYSHILSLKIGNDSQQVILKDMQRSPSKPRIAHMDFLRIRADQKLTMNVPLHFIGDEEAPGIGQGGVISHIMSDVEISCLPADLPEYIEIDTSKMELDDTLHLSDLKLPKGVTLVALSHGEESNDLPIVSIHKPRAIVEEAPVVAAAAEGEKAAEGKPEAGAEGKKE